MPFLGLVLAEAQILQLGTNGLLFLLIMGLAGAVEFKDFAHQFEERRGLLTGIFCQFFLLPLTGFLVVKSLQLDEVIGTTLLVATSSPGAFCLLSPTPAAKRLQPLRIAGAAIHSTHACVRCTDPSANPGFGLPACGRRDPCMRLTREPPDGTRANECEHISLFDLSSGVRWRGLGEMGWQAEASPTGGARCST